MIVRWHDRTGRGVRVRGHRQRHPRRSPAHRRDRRRHFCVRTTGGRGRRDRIGHGTAVAAAIREKARTPSLRGKGVRPYALDDGRQARSRHLLGDARGGRVINLSLGTARAEHAVRLSGSLAFAVEGGAVIVAVSRRRRHPLAPGQPRRRHPQYSLIGHARESVRAQRSLQKATSRPDTPADSRCPRRSESEGDQLCRCQCQRSRGAHLPGRSARHHTRDRHAAC